MSGKEKVAQLKVASLKGYRPQRVGQRHFKCPLCEYSSIFRSAITGHLPTHCDERPFCCTMCNYSTKRSGDLHKHKQTKHFQALKNSDGTSNGGKSSGLMICDNDTDLLSDNMNANINEALKINGVTPFNFADVLGENISPTSSSSSYRQVQGATMQNISSACQEATRTGKRGGGGANSTNAARSWNCQFCPVVFLDKALYFMHMGMHSLPNPWKCNVCHGVYNDVYGFTSHIVNGHDAR